MVGSDFGASSTNGLNPPCVNNLGWWGLCNGVGNVFGTFWPANTNRSLLNATAYLTIVVEHANSFMAIIYPSFNSYIQHDGASCHKA